MPRLFYPADYPLQDAVVAASQDHTEALLSQEVPQEFPPLIQGLVKPYTRGCLQPHSYIESSLSRVVTALFHQLNLAQSKHLVVNILNLKQQQMLVCCRFHSVQAIYRLSKLMLGKFHKQPSIHSDKAH